MTVRDITITKEEAIAKLDDLWDEVYNEDSDGYTYAQAIDMAIESLSSDSVRIEVYRDLYEKYIELKHKTEWIPLSHDGGVRTDLFHAYDGEWVIVTDGNAISVERIRTYPYDHFAPEGRWFELEDVIAWMPPLAPYKERKEE